MNHWKRIAYAVALTVVLGAATLLILLWTSPDMAHAFLYDNYWLAIFVVAYLVAPLASRVLKMH